MRETRVGDAHLVTVPSSHGRRRSYRANRMDLNVSIFFRFTHSRRIFSSCAIRRHVHLELCSVSRQLNIIFGLQIVMQAIAFHVFNVQFVNEFYHTVSTLNSDTPRGIRIHIFIIFA